MRSLLLLLVRREALWALVWTGVVGAVVVATPSAYETTYATAEARRAAVELAQRDGATTLLYGRLPDPGDAAQLFGWEIGTFLTLAVAVMAVLSAVRLTRAAEEAGVVELVRACGLKRSAPLGAALFGLLSLMGLVAGATFLGLLPSLGRVGGLDLPGTATLAAVVAVTFLVIAMATAVLAQVLPNTWSLRVGGTLMLAAFFGVRATADTQDLGWLNWLSPLGLRATAQPFTHDRWLPLLVAAVIPALLAGLAVRLDDRRELGAGLVRLTSVHDHRLHVSSPPGLLWRLARSTTTWWVLGIGVGAAFFVSMGSTAVESARSGDLSGGFMDAALGDGDPLVGYLNYAASVLVIVTAGYAILMASRPAKEERNGRGEQLRATGVSAPSLLAAHGAVAVTGTLAALAATAAMAAASAQLTFSERGVAREAVRQVVDQAGGVLVILALTLLVAGLVPRLVWLGWAPFAASVVLAMLGNLLGLPKWLIDLGAFADPGGPLGTLVRVAVAAGLIALGVAGVRYRDLAAG